MPCLVMFLRPDGHNNSYGKRDIIEVLPVDTHPGAAFEEVSAGFGFIFINDKAAFLGDGSSSAFRTNMMQPLLKPTDNSGDGGDVGDFDLEVSADTGQPMRRKHRMRNLPGLPTPEHRWKGYRPFSNGLSVKMDHADFVANHLHPKSPGDNHDGADD